MKSTKKGVGCPHSLFPFGLVITLLNPNMASSMTPDHCKMIAHRSRSQATKTTHPGNPVLNNLVPNSPIAMFAITGYCDIKGIQFIVITCIYRSYRVVSSSDIHLHFTKLDCTVRVDICLTADSMEGSDLNFEKIHLIII